VLQDLPGLSESPEKVPDRLRRPDRVYGLRETDTFEGLLEQVAKESPPRDTIRQWIRTSPFKDMAQPLLFPFLILEAKSEKSSDGFEQIQCQTAFPIKLLLQLQDGLQRKAIQVSSPGPLLWFLSCRGDTWRVHGCYIRDEEVRSYVRTLISWICPSRTFLSASSRH
jgi:hypothetical protein